MYYLWYEISCSMLISEIYCSEFLTNLQIKEKFWKVSRMFEASYLYHHLIIDGKEEK